MLAGVCGRRGRGLLLRGSPSVVVIVASPWTVRRRWSRPVCTAQVVVGSVVEWRRMAWSPSVISSHRSVPLWTAHSLRRSRNPLRSGVVQCCGGSSIVVMEWVRGFFCVVGGDGAWGISSSGCCGAFAFCSSALMVAKTSGRVGEAGGWGAGSFQVMWYSSGLSGLWDGDGGGGVVFRCPSVWIVVEGVEGDGVAVFPAVER